MSETPPPASTPPTDLAEPASDERTLAMISHALSFVEGGVPGPLLVYFFRKDALGVVGSGKDAARESAFVAFHSLQSLYFGLIFAVISVPVALLTCGWGLFLTVPIYFIFELIACLRVMEGRWYRLPFAGDWAARTHEPPPGEY